MSSIIIYNHPSNEDPVNRIEGMIEAGAKIRTGAPAVTNNNEAKALVHGIVDETFAGDTSHADFEATGEPPRKIVGDNGANYDLQGTNEKLQLSGAADLKDNNVHKMSSVIPAGANDNSWSYLSEKVGPDTAKLYIEHAADPGDVTKKKKLENYLIATFAFTRCD